MKSSQTAAALAVTTLVLTWALSGYADDPLHGSPHGSSTSTQDTQQQPMPSGSSSTGSPSPTMTDTEPTETTPSATTTQGASQAAYDPRPPPRNSRDAGGLGLPSHDRTPHATLAAGLAGQCPYECLSKNAV